MRWRADRQKVSQLLDGRKHADLSLEGALALASRLGVPVPPDVPPPDGVVGRAAGTPGPVRSAGSPPLQSGSPPPHLCDAAASPGASSPALGGTPAPWKDMSPGASPFASHGIQDDRLVGPGHDDAIPPEPWKSDEATSPVAPSPPVTSPESGGLRQRENPKPEVAPQYERSCSVGRRRAKNDPEPENLLAAVPRFAME